MEQLAQMEPCPLLTYEIILMHEKNAMEIVATIASYHKGPLHYSRPQAGPCVALWGQDIDTKPLAEGFTKSSARLDQRLHVEID